MFELFRSIEGYDRYQISESGKLYDKKLERFIKPIFKKGYYALSLMGNDGWRKNVSRHRLVAKAFLLNDDEVNKTHVNHKNGVKGEDHFLNLEWCTPSYNRIHAIENGLAVLNKSVLVIDECGEEEVFSSIKMVAKELDIKYGRLKRLLVDESIVVVGGVTIKLLNPTNNNGKTSVVWRNLINRESGEFESIAEASKATDVSIHSIHNRLALPHHAIHKDGFQFARKREFEGWSYLGDFDKAYAESSWVKCVQLRWLDTEEVIEFEKQMDVSQYLGLSMAKVSVSLDQGKQPIVRCDDRFALLKRKSNSEDWRVVEDPFKEYSESRGFKPIVVTNVKDQTKVLFVSAKECSDKMNIGTTTLNWRLKKPGVIYADHTFDYLSN